MQNTPQQRRRPARRGWVWLLVLVLLAGGVLLLGFGSLRRGAVAPLEAARDAAAEATAAKVPSGPLTIYCGRSEPLMKPLFDRFGAESGASFVVRYADSWGFVEQIVAEGRKLKDVLGAS
jgi:hypothetical protein